MGSRLLKLSEPARGVSDHGLRCVVSTVAVTIIQDRVTAPP